MLLKWLFGFMLVVYGSASFGSVEDVHEKHHSNYEDMSWKAVISMNKASNDIYHWIPVRVIRARQQLVGGVKYMLSILVARSNCTKKAVQHEDIRDGGCWADDKARKQLCKVEINSRVWEGLEDIVHKGCSEAPTKDLSWIEGDSLKLLPDNDDDDGDQQENLMQKTEPEIRVEDVGIWNLFSAFTERYNRTYKTKSELLKRFRIYKHNKKLVKDYQMHEKGTAVYGETVFSDLSQEEFKKIMLPYIWPTSETSENIIDLQDYNVDVDDIPQSIDWRLNNTVTAVKDQGSCGSCWAFSVTGNIEGAWARKTNNLVSLSEQELVDCDIVDQGCNGGLPLNAYKEIIRIGGLEPEKDYPYSGRGHKCSVVKKEIAVYINSSIELPHNEEKMAAWLAAKGPISIGINAGLLQFYRHGIAHPWKFLCSSKHLDHGVLIVGYGTEGDKPYWIVKNSWGKRWGENGYFRIYRGKNVCGIQEMPTTAIIN